MNYQVGPWQFIINRCQLSSGNIERELDPLLVKLLLHFVGKPQQIIARQELVEFVWQQSFVDDNAINRAISELRKQLAHPTEKAPLLKTHYRKGYSLTVDVTYLPERSPKVQPEVVLEQAVVNSQQQPEKSVEQDNKIYIDAASHKSSKRLLAVSLVSLICVTVFGWFYLQQLNVSTDQPIKSVKTNLVASTWNLGSEVHPELSSDRQFLGYSNVEPDNGILRSFIKRLSDLREVELTYPGLQVAVLSWQLNQASVLLMATNLADQHCELILVDLNDFPNIGKAQSIKQCDLRYTGYAQVDELAEYIYYTEYKNEHGGAGLYRYDIKWKKESTIIPPMEMKHGATMPRLSFSGNELAYVSNRLGEPFSVFVYNLTTRESKRVFQAKRKTLSFAFDWLPEEAGMIISEGDELTTMLFKESGTTKKTVKLTPTISPFYIAAQSQNSFFYSPSKIQRYSLSKVSGLFNGDFSHTVLHESAGNNHDLVEISNNQGSGHLFVSDRSGSDQLWLFQNGREKQLSNFVHQNELKPVVSGLQISPNKDRVLLRLNNDVVFFDLNSLKLYPILELEGRMINSYAWSKDNESVLYIEQVESNSVLTQLNLLTRDTFRKDDINANKLVTDFDGNNYAIADKQLISVPDGKSWDLPVDARPAQFFAAKDNYLYYTDAISRVGRFNLQNETFQDVHVDFKLNAFSLNENSDFLFSEREHKDTQIMQINWVD